MYLAHLGCFHVKLMIFSCDVAVVFCMERAYVALTARVSKVKYARELMSASW